MGLWFASGSFHCPAWTQPPSRSVWILSSPPREHPRMLFHWFLNVPPPPAPTTDPAPSMWAEWAAAEPGQS